MIVLTGSIATGKSSTCRILKEFGYEIIDADEIAKEVIDPNEIKKLFGPIYVSNDTIDRKALGSLVFNNPQKRKVLNNYIHPLIKEEIYKKVSKFEEKKIKYIVDIPLFYESEHYEAQMVALVYCCKEEQLKRLMKRDNLNEEEARQRIDSQISIEDKLKKAHYVIDNQKDEEHLLKEVKKFIGKISANFKI